MNLIIETERLIIRPPKLGDALPLNKAINESLEELQRWMPWALDPSLKTTEAFIARGIEYWQESKPKELPMIVELKNSGAVISASGFYEKSDFDIPMFETGYWIDKKYAGNGYITEAVIAVSRLAFEYFRAVRVQICAQKENIKSIAVAKRAGFIKEATLKNYRLDCVSHKPCDEIIYACFDKQMLPKLNLFKIIKK